MACGSARPWRSAATSWTSTAPGSGSAVSRAGCPSRQPVAGDELRAVKRHLATRTNALPWLFISERGQPLTRQSVNYLVDAPAARAGLPGVRPHTLRHSCGFALANKGYDLRLIQDYLGHRDPGTPSTTAGPRAGASRGCGNDNIPRTASLKRAWLIREWSLPKSVSCKPVPKRPHLGAPPAAPASSTWKPRWTAPCWCSGSVGTTRRRLRTLALPCGLRTAASTRRSATSARYSSQLSTATPPAAPRP